MPENLLRQPLTPTLSPRRAGRGRRDFLKLIAPQPAVDGDDRAGDVARHWRGEEHGQCGEVFGFAPIAHRDFFLGKVLAVIFRIIAPDLLAHDAAGWNAV